MTKKQEILTFKPKEATKKLIAVLPDRAKDVITKRFGIGAKAEKETLESIGKSYGITRERVRQIENFAIATIRKSPAYEASTHFFDELKNAMDSYGGIVHEEEFLEAMAKDASTQNHIHFMLVLGDAFTRLKEDGEFHHRWTTDSGLADKVHGSIRNLCKNFSEKDLISETELVADFLKEIKDISSDPKVEEYAKNWLAISKSISKNPLGEWGLAESPNVKMRGIRDYAFLVIRQHGSPMHFTEVAENIAKYFGKHAHPATCHNELIKDKRFVLVGRGLYALAEWGYSKGIVADVIKNILAEAGPLSKEEIIARVLKERYVKENTIIVNLQNNQLFKKTTDGLYALA